MTKINLDNPSYLNQLYENNSRLFNISPIRKSPLNQLSETATAVRERLFSQYTCLTHTLGEFFLFSSRYYQHQIALCQHFHFCFVIRFPTIYLFCCSF